MDRPYDGVLFFLAQNHLVVLPAYLKAIVTNPECLNCKLSFKHCSDNPVCFLYFGFFFPIQLASCPFSLIKILVQLESLHIFIPGKIGLLFKMQCLTYFEIGDNVRKYV